MKPPYLKTLELKHILAVREAAPLNIVEEDPLCIRTIPGIGGFISKRYFVYGKLPSCIKIPVINGVLES